MWLVIKEKLKTQDRLRQWDVRAITGMYFVPPRFVDVLAFLIPSKGSLVSNVISWIVLAAMTYCLWNEQNSRLFKKKKSNADQIVQLATSLVRLKLVTFKFKKMTTGPRLLLDQWKIPSSCLDHDGSSRLSWIVFAPFVLLLVYGMLAGFHVLILMKAKNEDLYRANVFIKTRTANNGTIPDEDTRIVVDRMKEKLNEVPQSEQTNSFKEQVFIDLVGSDGHESVKTFGGGVSSRKVFGPRSSLMNTTSSHAIERMVQAQVAVQLEAKVAERVANLVVDQDAQIEAKVAAYVSNHEKAQMEWFKKLELLLGREFPPPPGYHAHRPGSSAGE
ncbi:reverse transcriptase domain, reverse transcriptase zinc-binding domain protein, partial [Tanacetum coccineum]